MNWMGQTEKMCHGDKKKSFEGRHGKRNHSKEVLGTLGDG